MLPTIADYSSPQPGELPANRAPWRIEPARAVLLIHDMQRYFVDAFPPRAQVLHQAIGNIQRLRQAAGLAGVPAYFTAQPPSQTPQQRGLLTDFWGGGIQADGRHAIIEELQPVPGEDLIIKWRYDAFLRTDLEHRLQRAGRDQLIVTGIYAHIGVLQTAISAFMRDVQPFVVADAIADFSLDEHRHTLHFAARRCACVIASEAALSGLAAEPTCR